MFSKSHRFYNNNLSVEKGEDGNYWICSILGGVAVAVCRQKNGKWFAVIDLIDSNSNLTKLRYWGVNKDTIRDEILLNEVYIIKPQYSDGWGFSTSGHVDRAWKRMTTNKED